MVGLRLIHLGKIISKDSWYFGLLQCHEILGVRDTDHAQLCRSSWNMKANWLPVFYPERHQQILHWRINDRLRNGETGGDFVMIRLGTRDRTNFSVADPGGGGGGGGGAPPLILDQLCFFDFFKIRMLKNKAQIALNNPRASRAWTPAESEFGSALVMCVRAHTLLCPPPPPPKWKSWIRPCTMSGSIHFSFKKYIYKEIYTLNQFLKNYIFSVHHYFDQLFLPILSLDFFLLHLAMNTVYFDMSIAFIIMSNMTVGWFYCLFVARQKLKFA